MRNWTKSTNSHLRLENDAEDALGNNSDDTSSDGHTATGACFLVSTCYVDVYEDNSVERLVGALYVCTGFTVGSMV
jgi:hypothetical protein